MNAINFDCPGCGAPISASAEKAGSIIPCSACGAEVFVPPSSDAASTLVVRRRSEAATADRLAADLLAFPAATTVPTLAPPEPAPVAIGRYRDLGEIGRGGMGIVYRAHDPVLDRVVALKTLVGHAKPDWVQRFMLEARSLAKLRHPGIVPIHDLGESEGLVYFTMDLIEGKTFAAALLDGGLSAQGVSPADTRRVPATAEERARRLPATLGIIADVALAVGYAHEHGIVHRDLKPNNILLDKEGRSYVTDFGLAKNAAATTSATETGTVMGTPWYMSPEQALGQNHDVTAASDVFALGVMLYEVLTGRLPFVGPNQFKVRDAIVHATPIPPSEIEPSTPTEVERICLKALEKDPASRYPTARDLARDLRRYLETRTPGEEIPTVQPIEEETLEEVPAEEPPTSKPSRIWHYVAVYGLVADVLLGLLTWWLWDRGPASVSPPEPDATVDVAVGLREAEQPSDSRAPLVSSLAWLARHQSRDGSWKVVSFSEQCSGTKCAHPGFDGYDTGVTGLALLAFLQAGYTHLSLDQVTDKVTGETIELGDAPKSAVRWLVDCQEPNGRIGGNVSKSMYNHAICTLALCKAYMMTKSQALREPTQKAIDWLVGAKNPHEAWRYTAQCGENDSSVTGWCLMALMSAELSRLKVSRSSITEGVRWIEDVTDEKRGKVGYQGLQDSGAEAMYFLENQGFGSHEAAAAVGMVVRMLVRTDRTDPLLERAAALISTDLPVWDKVRQSNDYYYWYWATLALSEHNGLGTDDIGGHWDPWRKATMTALTTGQATERDGCEAGSWDADDRWGWAGGRVYATAINALTLELYYRHLSASHSDRPPK